MSDRLEIGGTENIVFCFETTGDDEMQSKADGMVFGMTLLGSSTITLYSKRGPIAIVKTQ